MGFTDAFPRTITKAYFAPESAGRVFNHWQVVTSCDLQNGVQITRHPHLMHWHESTCPGCDSGFNESRIDVVGGWIDVHENRLGAAIAHGISRGNERMADGNHFIAWLDAND